MRILVASTYSRFTSRERLYTLHLLFLGILSSTKLLLLRKVPHHQQSASPSLSPTFLEGEEVKKNEEFSDFQISDDGMRAIHQILHTTKLADCIHFYILFQNRPSGTESVDLALSIKSIDASMFLSYIDTKIFTEVIKEADSRRTRR